MKKSLLLLALNALEVKLLNARQDFKRNKLDEEVDSLNRLLEETRQNIEEVSIYSPDKINLKCEQ
tara:strand:- start:232 stop:426 length:195 start_codon:yes stop_codon:yes gene_type:complete